MAPPAAMPDDAYRAAITPAPGALTHLEPGVMRDCAIAVRNLSFTDWDRRVSGLIRLGNHWLGPDGTMLIQDDGRSALPQCVAGGTEATLVVPVTAPREPGHYLCEFDLVHEHVCWFGDRGSRTARVQVTVGDGAGPGNDGTGDAAGAHAVYPEIDEVLPPLDPGVELGEFPMYGVAKDEVLEILRALGTDCVHIEPDERGGPEWVGYRYFVRRNA
jgi:hypothetical protein